MHSNKCAWPQGIFAGSLHFATQGSLIFVTDCSSFYGGFNYCRNCQVVYLFKLCIKFPEVKMHLLYLSSCTSYDTLAFIHDLCCDKLSHIQSLPLIYHHQFTLFLSSFPDFLLLLSESYLSIHPTHRSIASTDPPPLFGFVLSSFFPGDQILTPK